MMSLGSEVKGGRRTLCVLPVRILMRCSLVIRVWWDTVLNAAEKLSRIRAAVSPRSRRVVKSSVAAIKVVSVLWLLRNPDCEASRRLFLSRCSVSWWLIAFLRTFEGKGSREMGR